MPTREEVLKQAMELSPEDREILQIQLYYSLQPASKDSEATFATPELAAKWSAEIDRRIAAYQRGEMKAQDSESAMQELRDYLHEKNQRRQAS